ncbi:MAG: copper amine oxidase N-terminal domain-containing protein [Clostridia bacterium]|nr:copper amine oxidase N-terminal domain-containing protein [Clostridia bacterium]
MKKVLFSGALLLFSLLFFTPFTFAADYVAWTDDVNVTIDGTSSKYYNLPVTSKSVTLFPVSDILKKAGIQADKGHIVWDSTEKSITITKDSIKASFKIGSRTAYINNKPVTLNTEPMLYMGKSYIQASFLAECMGKKAMWDYKAGNLIIYDEAQFNAIKEALQKANSQLAASNKFKFSIDMDSNEGEESNIKINAFIEWDGKNKLLHGTSEFGSSFYGKEYSEIYATEKTSYERSSKIGAFEKQEETDEYQETIQQGWSMIKSSFIDKIDDFMIASLKARINSANELVIEGIIFENNPDSKTIAKIVLDSKTYNYKVIHHSLLKYSSYEDSFSKDIMMIKFSDWDGDFKIVLPKELAEQ